MKKNVSHHQNIPESPGVYLFKDKKGSVIYIGKAGNLKKRVSSYFTRPGDLRTEKMVSEIKTIDFQKTDSALEALILESELIKKISPLFNVREKDDKSFLWIEITKEEYPRVVLTRGREKNNKSDFFGPFVYAGEARQALKILRKIFPFSIHPTEKIGTFKRTCLDAQIGLCPGTCVGEADKKEYCKNIRMLKQFLKRKKKILVRNMEREMKKASDKLEFEQAEKLKRQIFALRHIQDTALVGSSEFKGFYFNRGRTGLKKEKLITRIEGYDVSNISGTSAVGAMAVFKNGEPDNSQYRKFKIRTVTGQDDTGMMQEVLLRRFKREDWSLPSLVLVDGGTAQVNVAKKVLSEYGIKIPVVGIAKGPKRKKNEFFGTLPEAVEKKTLIRLRDEAHRFAVKYHRELRDGEMRIKRKIQETRHKDTNNIQETRKKRQTGKKQ